MTAWTPQQIQCLDALGIAPMAFVKPQLKPSLKPELTRASTSESESAALAPEPTPSSAGTAETETKAQRYFYRIGPWYVSAAKQLPVEGIPWLNDLARYANTRVSQVNDVDDALDIDPYITAPLTPEQKQQLWAQLKARLNRTRQATETAPS